MVCKEGKNEENLTCKYHEEYLRIQSDAAALAVNFNRRVCGLPEWHVSFLTCHIYNCKDYTWDYTDGQVWLLVEPELDGKFTKWNNNAGGVSASPSKVAKPKVPNPFSTRYGGALGGIIEEDEDEDVFATGISIEDVPQAFSHFTFEASNHKKLVCDIQGVWNKDDGFVLTDPVAHYISSRGVRHKNGATDKGFGGVCNFLRHTIAIHCVLE